MKKIAAACVAAYALAVGGVYGVAHWASRSPSPPQSTETIYVQDVSPKSWSRASIERDIPAWEKAANGYFSQVWRTEQVRIELLAPRQRAPRGAIVARIVKNGPVQGALAYHTVNRGSPEIVVYAGVGDFYGYSNSVSFTHELFELLVDPTTSRTDWSPFNSVVTVGSKQYSTGSAPVSWFGEVCDPVEAYSYGIQGVQISDWITPNWFADQVNGGFDYMNVIQQPLVVARGGYAQFWNGFQWQAVTFFRHAGSDPRGFYLGERPLTPLVH